MRFKVTRMTHRQCLRSGNRAPVFLFRYLCVKTLFSSLTGMTSSDRLAVSGSITGNPSALIQAICGYGDDGRTHGWRRAQTFHPFLTRT